GGRRQAGRCAGAAPGRFPRHPVHPRRRARRARGSRQGARSLRQGAGRARSRHADAQRGGTETIRSRRRAGADRGRQLMKAAIVPRAHPRASLVVLAAAMLALGGCSTIKGWFGGKSTDALKPAELTAFTATAAPQRLWSVSVGGGEDRLGARQGPSVAGGRVFAAAVEGGVSALDLQTGQSLWHYASDLALAGGPGVGDGLVVAGGLEGD